MRISDWSSDVCSSDLTTGKASSASLVRGNAAGELARKALISSIAWARVSCTEQKLVTQIYICEGSRPTDLAASRKSAICCASLSSCLAPEKRFTVCDLDRKCEERCVGKGCVCTCRCRWTR